MYTVNVFVVIINSQLGDIMDSIKGIVCATVISILIGYGIGCINLSYFLSKWKGFDIRRYGSGNAGASNVVIVMGRKIGMIVAIVDILKAFFAVKISLLLFPAAVQGRVNWASCLAGTFAILGHIFPFYMGFKGGKGLASLGGVILAVDSKLFVVLFLISLFIALVTNYICFVPISMAIVFPILLCITRESWLSAAIFSLASVVILYRHIGNLKRIKAGDEAKFSLLWNRDEEAERFGIKDDGVSVFSLNVDENGESGIVKNDSQ